MVAGISAMLSTIYFEYRAKFGNSDLGGITWDKTSVLRCMIENSVDLIAGME